MLVPPARFAYCLEGSVAPPDQPNRDTDSSVSPVPAIDSNPSAFDGLDADPTSSHSSMAHASGGFGHTPPTQNELVGALGSSNACSYPSLNLPSIPWASPSSGDSSEGENGVEMN